MQEVKRGLMLVTLLVAVATGWSSGVAQVPTTTVQDTVYLADGSPASGTVVVSWDAFTTSAGAAVAASSVSAAIEANGGVSLSLAPNDGALPTGSFYTAVYHLQDGSTSTEYWTVPVAAAGVAVSIAAIRSSVLPASVAVQTVSKAYVDSAIAAVVSGGPIAGSTFLQKTGDAMTGDLELARDPATPLQAADKHYVDTATIALSSGLDTKVSSVPTLTQTIAQPDGTQLGVNLLNGEVYASAYANGPGNNGVANALQSTNCSHGCVVKAEPTYASNESVSPGRIPDGGHVVDQRGGAEAHTVVNPLGVDTGDLSSGTSWAQIATRSTPALKAIRPGIFGQASVTMDLSNTAMTGGSNQFPADIENVPYGKNTYGVTSATGNYFTQGQHVQATNYINCFGVGDCLAGSLYITSSGGYRDQADEGAHPFDRQVLEDFRVFQGTCTTGCTTGSTSLAVTATAAAGTQGDGRYLINKNPAKVITTGSLVGGGRGVLGAAVFSGTSFPVSVLLQTAAVAKSQAGDMAPGTVTLPISTSSVPAGFASSTAALTASSGVACVADSEAAGSVFPNFETASYSVVDATHLKLTLAKVHAPNAVVAVGGLCGYGLEQVVDTTSGVRQVFPVVASTSATSLFYADALTTIVGLTSDVSTSGYQNVTLPIASVTRGNGVATVTLGSPMLQDFQGLTVSVSGVADASFNGSFKVSTAGPTTLSYASPGADGTSAGGSMVLLTGAYALYPMAEVRSVFNPATKLVDGLMTLAPNTVAWAAGDAVEEPHYYQQYTFGDTEYVKQYVPRTISYVNSGKEYDGEVGPGVRGWQITNGVPKSNYLGAGGTHRPPDDAHLVTGVWNNDFEVDAGEQAVLRVHCNLHGCNRWNSVYAVLSMDAALGQDFLTYDPATSTAQFVMGGASYQFAPNALIAKNVQAQAVNATAVAAGSLAVNTAGVTPKDLLQVNTQNETPNPYGFSLVNQGGGGVGFRMCNTHQGSCDPVTGALWQLFDSDSGFFKLGRAYVGDFLVIDGNGHVNIGGASAPTGLFSVGTSSAFQVADDGTVSAPQLVARGATPSVSAGAAAGSGATASVSGAPTAGVLTLTAGSGAAANSTAVTVSFPGRLSAAPQGCTAMARNANAAGVSVFTGAPSTAGWSLGVGAVALQAGAIYQWSYACF